VSGAGDAELNKLSVTAFRRFADVAALEDAILRLNHASRRPSAFDTPQYLRIAWENEEFPDAGREPLLLAAFEDGELVGFLPLRKGLRKALGRSETVIDFVITHDEDRMRVISAPEDEERCAAVFYGFLINDEPGWSLLELVGQDAASKLFPVPIKVSKRFHVRTFASYENATIEFPPTFQEYMLGLSRASRKSLRSNAREFLAGGEVIFISSHEPRAALEMLNLYLDLEKHSWKARVNGTVGRDARRIAFFRNLLTEESQFTLHVNLLLLNAVPVAGDIAGRFRNEMWIKEACYDEAFSSFAPGNVLALILVAQAIARGDSRLNLLRDFGYYKKHWGAVMSETKSVQIYRFGSLHYFRAVAGSIGRRFGLLRRPRQPQHRASGWDCRAARRRDPPPSCRSRTRAAARECGS
jgi:hypothetical protein